MPVRGAVDAVLGRFVIGWAQDPDDGGRRIALAVELDGATIASGTADLERGDLLAAGIGDGCHAFRIELPGPLEPGSRHTLNVRVEDDHLSLPLAGDFDVELESGRTGPPPIVTAAPAGTPLPTPPPAARPAAPLPPTLHPEGKPVLLGAGGWLFELADPELLGRMLGRTPVEAGDVEAFRRRLVDSTRQARGLGAAYLAAVLPDKATLYAERLEHLPASSQTLRPVDLIAAALRDDNDADLIDLLAPLRDARRHGLLASRASAGLTWRGAFHAYRAIAKDLAKRFPTLEPRPLSWLRLGVQVPLQDSLAGRNRVVLLGGELVRLGPVEPEPDSEPELAGDALRARYRALPAEFEGVLGGGATMLENLTPEVRASAVVIHDGGGSRVASLLAEHFERTLVAASSQLPETVVEQERPAVVIQLFDELTFARLPPA